MEEPKRLTPKENTFRKLLTTSGNSCAYPNCPQKIVDEDMDYVGKVCHIEAALPGGRRFNPNQTNEERRDYDNLILMCGVHHDKIDSPENEDEYPVDLLRQWKVSHEKRNANNRYEPEEKVIESIINLMNVEFNDVQGDVVLNENPQIVTQNVYNNTVLKDERDFGIISDIIDHLLNIEPLDVKSVEEIRNEEHFPNLKKKIEINFADSEKKAIGGKITSIWALKETVERFVKVQEATAPQKVAALIEKIRTDYRTINNSQTHEEKFKSLRVLEEMLPHYIPNNYVDNPEYLSAATAILVYFFEYCEFGLPTQEEIEKQSSLF